MVHARGYGGQASPAHKPPKLAGGIGMIPHGLPVIPAIAPCGMELSSVQTALQRVCQPPSPSTGRPARSTATLFFRAGTVAQMSADGRVEGGAPAVEELGRK